MNLSPNGPRPMESSPTSASCHHGGAIELIIGPMFSGKSTELLRRIRRFTVARKQCLVVKYARDTRYTTENKMATHDKVLWGAYAANQLADVPQALVDAADVIGVDEGQFFPDIVEFCENAAAQGKIVVIGALDGTFQRKPFGRVLELVPLADNVTKLCAVCMVCGDDAPFTARLTNETAVEVIGGAESYAAVCRTCYFSPPKERPAVVKPIPFDTEGFLAQAATH